MVHEVLLLCEWKLEAFEQALGVEWPYIRLALRVWRQALGLWPRGVIGPERQLPAYQFFYGQLWRLKGVTR